MRTRRAKVKPYVGRGAVRFLSHPSPLQVMAWLEGWTIAAAGQAQVHALLHSTMAKADRVLEMARVIADSATKVAAVFAKPDVARAPVVARDAVMVVSDGAQTVRIPYTDGEFKSIGPIKRTATMNNGGTIVWSFKGSEKGGTNGGT